jgi:membrane protease subunit HflK
MTFGNGNWPKRGNEDPVEGLRELGRQWRGFAEGIGPGLILLIILVAYLASGIFIVAPDERAIVLRFGKAVRDAGPGPHYRLPAPIERELKVQVTKIRKEEIGFQTISTGGAPRYRQVPREALMLTGDNNIVDLDFIIQYRVKQTPEGLTDFLFNVSDPRQALRDAAEAAMREVIGASKIDEALTEGKDRIQQSTQELLQSILDEYGAGIDIVIVKLQDVEPPGDVIDAFKDVISAEQDKERLINESRGYANDILPKARGQAAQVLNEAQAYAQAIVSEAEGSASRFVAVYEEYAKAKDVTKRRLYLETMTRVIARADKIILDRHVGDQTVPYLSLDALRSKKAGGAE